MSDTQKEKKNLQTINEQLKLKEEECISRLGYNPTSEIEDHEWEAMLKRNEMSLEKENKK